MSPAPVIGAMIAGGLLGPPATSAPAAEADPRFEAFRRLASLGFEQVLVHLFADDSLLAAIDSLPADQAIRLDLDGDGRIDALAWREGATRVVGLDDDGDLREGDLRPDTDSDCMIADLLGDGIPDRVVDMTDLDGDGDPDRQDLYEITAGALGVPGIGVTVVFDLDDDNRFFDTTDYGYHANRNQWRSDFDGTLAFVAGRRVEETGRWISCFENPFCFYDEDGDGWTDEALRLEGEDLRIDSIRWSFDIDGDSAERGDRDYDFSITAIGPVHAPPALADSVRLRDGKHLRFVAHEHARKFVAWGLWRSALLVWVEDDRNTAPQTADAERSRWEGVIADPFRGFPAVGGPSCGRIGKRYELDADGSGRLRLAWSERDRRIHLLGAEAGESILISSDGSDRHRTIATEDADGNGHFDTWTEWTEGEGQPRPLRARDEGARMLPRDAAGLRRFWLDWARRGAVDPFPSTPALSASPKEWSLRERGRSGASVAIPVAKLPRGARRAIHPDAIVELLHSGGRVRGQVEDLDSDGAADHIYFPRLEIDVARPRLLVDPPSPLPIRETVRVDPWFAGGIAFESALAAFRTYGGRLDFFLKRQARLILRGSLGDYHRMQPWGIDALTVGDGPGIGGLYLLDERGGVWVPLFGPDAVKRQRVVVPGPLRAIVEVTVGSGDLEVLRRWTIAGTDSTLAEEIRIRGKRRRVLAVAIPPLDRIGSIPGSLAIWSEGVSVPEAGPIRIEGTCVAGRSAAVTQIAGRPAIRFVAEGSRPARFAWTARAVLP